MQGFIVFDTETTGLSPRQGHRILQIGCVALSENYMPTGDTMEWTINPERDIPSEATAVHGITNRDVADAPTFSDICDGFLDFVGDAPLVAHNASFDMAFINAELSALGRTSFPETRFIDTLALAKTQFPRAIATLDALCRRFSIDLSSRNVSHGALVDAHLLAKVYFFLMGGAQYSIAMDDSKKEESEAPSALVSLQRLTNKPFRMPRSFFSAVDEEQHRVFVDRIPDSLWLKS